MERKSGAPVVRLRCRTRPINDPGVKKLNRRLPIRGKTETKKGCRASRRYYLMSFKGMGKSIQNDEAPDRRPTPPSHPLDEFPAGYSWTGCSPALPASASPADGQYAVFFSYTSRTSAVEAVETARTSKHEQTNPKSTTCRAHNRNGSVFCPNDGGNLHATPTLPSF